LSYNKNKKVSSDPKGIYRGQKVDKTYVDEVDLIKSVTPSVSKQYSKSSEGSISIEDILKEDKAEKVEKERVYFMGKDKDLKKDNLNKPEEPKLTELNLSDYKTTEDKVKLQQILADSGENLNPNGTFKNEGIDGKIGKVTKQALSNYNNKVKQSNQEDFFYKNNTFGLGKIGYCTETQCSEFAQNEAYRRVKPDNVSLSLPIK